MGGGRVGGGQGGCEWRSEAWGLGQGGGVRVRGGQGGWEQRSEACLKIQKEFFFWGGGGGGGLMWMEK